MSRPWIFICPSSRGIGHALTRHLLRNTTVPIFATARSDPSAAKKSLLSGLDSAAADRLTIARVDVTDEGSIRDAAAQANELFPSSHSGKGGEQPTHHLRLAFAIPGVLHPEKAPNRVEYDLALDSYRINALGPLMLMKYFADFLPRKSTKLLDGEDGGESSGGSSSSASSGGTDSNRDQSSNATGEGGAVGGVGGYGGEPQQPKMPEKGSQSQGDDKLPKSNSGSASSGQSQTSKLTLPRHALWVNMSARVGSVTDNQMGGWYSYRSSKAAVNSLTMSLDRYLGSRSGDSAMSIAYHPGTVKTDLSKGYWERQEKGGLFEVDEAVQKMTDVVMNKVGVDGRGKCWDWRGEEVPP